MPGFACDKTSKSCVRGVAGVFCRDKDDCGFGNSCYLELPTPAARAQRRGICKPGLENTYACTRDMHCAGDLVCFSLSLNGNSFRRCGKLANFSSTPFPNGFGKCATKYDCVGLDCVAGRCQPRALGQRCAINPYDKSYNCPPYTTCEKGKCRYALAGSACYSGYGDAFRDTCSPGFQCTAATGVGAGKPGTCVAGDVGMRCYDGRECKVGLVCGSSRVCAKSAEGQRCLSNFWCPTGAQCHMYNRKCTFGIVPPRARFPPVTRSQKCRWLTDCSYGTPCINGICLPRMLAWTCTPPGFAIGAHCDPSTGIQVEGTLGKPCGSTRQCFIGLSCDGGTCKPSQVGSICSSRYNCPKNLYCNQSKCFKPRRGEVCGSHSHCQLGQSCIKGGYSGDPGACSSA